jgi:hypothetical protein
MPLNEAQGAAALAYLNGINAFKPCPTCGNGHWTVGDVVMAQSLAAGGHGFETTSGVGILLIECDRCGQFIAYNAAKIPGLMRPAAIDR